MKIYHTLFFLLAASAFHAQVISGTIISKNENQPIPYVKIGIEKKSIGTISDEKGNFSMDLSNTDPQQKIKIEVPGFDSYQETVQDFKKHDQQKIFLTEKTKNIKEITVKAKKLVDKNWGVNTKTKSVTYFVNPEFDKKNFLGETALEFNAKKRSKIKNINLNIASYVSNEPVLMRYSIYSEKNGFPDKNILEEEITVELTENMIRDGTYTLDVNDRNIWVHGKFFIGIQFLKDFAGRIKISAALFRTGFIREFYGDWQKMTIAAPAINIDVKMDKNGDKNTDDENGFVDDSAVALMPDVSKYIQESEQTVYGQNKAVGNYLKLQDTNLYYEIYGEGEPLILLHGNSGSIKDFYQQIPVLSKQYKVIAIDTRGQGKSIDSSKKDFTYKMFADDVKAVADQLKLNKVNIAGWSDGGNTGLEFALKYPEKLNKLITIGANAFPDGVDNRLTDHFENKMLVLKELKKPEQFNEQRLLKIMLTQPRIAKKDLNKIGNKVLVIAGDNDVIKRDHTELIAKEIPNAELKIYSNATHMIPFENADQLNTDILNFLGKSN
ncbi:pimeloyl-ACP methyl ester carboxylesterase [Chryseobacterium bernardetii]|jgi:pimeloyl-ACP methyl ester carboxylesterase|uniref:Pimeloyl-ACP methyl ester carboxylesterase n=2 Tax=Chryseobacterium TaxID=59732 RepID=A0A543ENH3_9FLAO|nr:MULTISPECIES: alpha/beta fold hydrolase [Chryseobacterium]MDR6369512.1 pimeloyl-ACP methyl ester carboxylesterase [Chryseobacterium vietnamense]MDR6439566.1 pimeloyl-ACP methyl ester carboxylesterase [Chryseobacterium bernardetii]TQM23120.1 pimeloyl-ACP methyl ester carboxylesterase [Chryseobacterium aquifrigidense]